jgi:hypothetical protein
MAHGVITIVPAFGERQNNPTILSILQMQAKSTKFRTCLPISSE